MFLMGLASGTSANPSAGPMPMLMTQSGGWNAMFMGVAFVSDIQQSGPRGGDKLYSTNWFMASAEHPAGAKGAFEVQLMLSLEPATVTGRPWYNFTATAPSCSSSSARRSPRTCGVGRT